MANLSIGIVGLPNVGKSTLFNALTSNGVPASNFPFCTIDPNVGVVEVFDNRLNVLSKISGSKKIIYATTQFVDIAGLVAGASKGEGLGNQFLAHIRETDAIVQVVRCFESEDVIHVAGQVDPIADIEVIGLELALADLSVCEKLITRLEKLARGDKGAAEEVAILKRVREALNDGIAVRRVGLSAEEMALIAPHRFITAKPMLYLTNVAESDLPHMDNKYVQMVRDYASKEKSLVVPICAKLEDEIAQLPPEERTAFLADVGLEQSGLQRLVNASFDLLGLINYITTGEIETRAWTVRRGANAVEAASKIHTDISKGFIRAEVVSFNDMVTYNGRVGAREHGRARAEGKEYIVQDGDVILFLHN